MKIFIKYLRGDYKFPKDKTNYNILIRGHYAHIDDNGVITSDKGISYKSLDDFLESIK